MTVLETMMTDILRYAPTDVCTAIYGGVSGAQYDSDLGQWVVPCDAEIDMALQIEYVYVSLEPTVH